MEDSGDVAVPPMPGDDRCLSCGKDFPKTKSVAALQCNLCRLWSHKPCTGLTEETYKFIVRSRGRQGLAWICTSCTTFSQKLNNTLLEQDGRLKRVEEKVKSMDKSVSGVQANLASVTNRVANLEIRWLPNQANIRSPPLQVEQPAGLTMFDIFSEMNQIKYREDNIIIHEIPPVNDQMSPMERKRRDLEMVGDVMRAIGAPWNDDMLAFIRRLGKFGQTACPIAIEFRKAEDKAVAMRLAHLLKDSQFSRVSISHDMTQGQRSYEAKLREIAEARNRENQKSEDPRPGIWKVKGRHGGRSLRLSHDGIERGGSGASLATGSNFEPVRHGSDPEPGATATHSPAPWPRAPNTHQNSWQTYNQRHRQNWNETRAHYGHTPARSWAGTLPPTSAPATPTQSTINWQPGNEVAAAPQQVAAAAAPGPTAPAEGLPSLPPKGIPRPVGRPHGKRKPSLELPQQAKRTYIPRVSNL